MAVTTEVEPDGDATIASESKRQYVINNLHATRTFSHYVAIFFWLGWMGFYFYFPVIAILLYYTAPKVLTAVLAVILISAFASAEYRKQPKFTRRIGAWTMSKAAEYFHLRVLLEDKPALEVSGPSVFAVEPHGVLPLGMCGFFDGQAGFTGHRVMGCVTGLIFKIPIMRHVFTWMTAGSVDRKDIIRCMDKKFSPVLCPGGVQECIHLATDANECVLYLRKRAGFVKLALRHGFPIVPVFTFGLHGLFSYYVPQSAYLQRLGRRMGALPMVLFGVFGIPFGPAKPCDLVNVIGRPIAVPHSPEPSDEEVKKYHELYIQEIERIYHAFKADYGMEHITLRII